MSRRSTATLQKRLSELESELSGAFQMRLGPHSNATQKISRRLQKRFGYISKLLSAEAAVSTPDKTDQLHELVEKFTELEAVFRWWNEHPSYAIQNYLQDNNDDDHHHSDGPEVAEKEDSGRIWRRFCKLCEAFGGGVIVGAVGCMSIINFYSLYIWDYQHIYDIHPT